ncbi:MAG TPA: hypothetical protein VL463_23345 [Kofleriaceae bacterium]|jgi:hypothetical protein|nr:hypothetical protein [Kofleriaceae bacterium]
MGSKILTKTDRAMEDRLLAVSNDPERADTIAKARAFKRTWLELAEALARVDKQGSWGKWGYTDFDAYCRKELHLRSSTVQKLLGSFRFLQSSAPRVIERARETETFDAPLPSLAAVEFVQKATERGAADEETLRTIHRAAFDEGADAPVLARRFKEAAFPIDARESKDKLRASIAAAARKLAALIAEEGSPVPKKLAIAVEETIGELLQVVEPPN